MKKNLSKKVSLLTSVFAFTTCMSFLSFASPTHIYTSLDFSESEALGGWESTAELETHGYKLDGSTLYLSDIEITDTLTVPNYIITISDDVKIGELTTDNTYDSSSSIHINGDGNLDIEFIAVGCGSLIFDGYEGLSFDVDSINNHNTGGTGLLEVNDVDNGNIKGISWTSLDGMSLENSDIVLGEDDYIFIEKIELDRYSTLHLKSHIDNYGNTSDGLDGLINYLPYGYEIKYEPTSKNSIYDSDGNLASDILLKYRDEFDITIVASPSNAGTISGDGTYRDGDLVTLIASPSNAYKFDGWESDGDLLSTNTTYKFTVNEDMDISALFSLIASGGDNSGIGGSTVGGNTGGIGGSTVGDNSGNNTGGNTTNRVPTPIYDDDDDEVYYTQGWVISSLGKKYRLSDGSYYRNTVKRIYGNDWAFDSKGYLYDGWFLLNGDWYYQTLDDGLKSGWYFENEDSKWYYLDTDSHKMLTGWQLVDNTWYYFNEYTPVQTWFYNTNEKSWYFDVNTTGRPLGSMYSNELTPDGYTVDVNGVYYY